MFSRKRSRDDTLELLCQVMCGDSVKSIVLERKEMSQRVSDKLMSIHTKVLELAGLDLVSEGSRAERRQRSISGRPGLIGINPFTYRSKWRKHVCCGTSAGSLC